MPESTFFITIRTQFEGLHCWPNAPEQVAFLRDLHRHIFKVEVTVAVTHADRDLEFFMVKAVIDDYLDKSYASYHHKMPRLKNLGPSSCEVVASDLAHYLQLMYGKDFKVLVREDDESSGEVVPKAFFVDS